MKLLLLSAREPQSYALKQIYEKPLKDAIPDVQLFSEVINCHESSVLAKRAWLESINGACKDFDVVIFTDAAMFKVAANLTKAEDTVGNIYFSKPLVKYVTYMPPEATYIRSTLKAVRWIAHSSRQLFAWHTKAYKPNGEHLKNANIRYLKEPSEIQSTLNLLLKAHALTVDVETRDLKIVEGTLFTIAFATDSSNAYTISVDKGPYGEVIRPMLKEFFLDYTGNLIAHNASFDFSVLTYVLFTGKDITNVAGALEGIDCLCEKFDDSKLIAYLATNSCRGDKESLGIGLKQLAATFAGDYAIDVTNNELCPEDDLLKYNAYDVLATWYVYDTYYPIMVSEGQLELYSGFMKQTLKNNCRMQLNGLPIDIGKAKELKAKLEARVDEITSELSKFPAIKTAQYLIAEDSARKANAKLKVKRKTPEECLEPFNYSSGAQLAVLLYDVLELPILERTPSNAPSAKQAIVNELKQHTDDAEVLNILELLSELPNISKLLSSFIPAFIDAHVTKNGDARYLGHFNIGATVSGRLSSSNPNLQQLPSTGNSLAESVKKCFRSTNEWIFIAADFKQLEARIDALTSKDPMKLRVYTEGFDSHCLGSYLYFKEQMPDITEELKGYFEGNQELSSQEAVEIINSIKSRYPTLRQDSKAISFALQYGGTEHTLVKNSGLTYENARNVISNYSKAYSVSLAWKQAELDKARKLGYVTTGFGLKLRTPLLASSLDNGQASQQEARTAGNALGQGWGVLNDRARNEIIDEIDKAGHSLDILPVAAIHDANYFLIKNSLKLISWFNDVLVKAYAWNDHPSIYHPTVGLGGSLELFIPDWSSHVELPDHAEPHEILNLIKVHKDAMENH